MFVYATTCCVSIEPGSVAGVDNLSLQNVFETASKNQNDRMRLVTRRNGTYVLSGHMCYTAPVGFPTRFAAGGTWAEDGATLTLAHLGNGLCTVATRGTTSGGSW